MKVGDLVRYKIDGTRLERYPFQYEMGVIVRFKMYHPVVAFPSAVKYVGRERLEVLSESR